MAMLWLHSALVVALLVLSCPGAASQQHLCGPHLVEALHLVCGHRGFYHSSRDIESVFRYLSPEEVELLSMDGQDGVEDFAAKKQMDMMVKRQIVDECCNKPCSMSVLEKYCN